MILTKLFCERKYSNPTWLPNPIGLSKSGEVVFDGASILTQFGVTSKAGFQKVEEREITPSPSPAT